jgi:hypothetical protein
MVSLRMGDGSEASLALRGVQARQVTAAVPGRKTRSARGQLQARVGGHARRHVPDFLLVHADNPVHVVNVKPAERLD